jgi:phosphoribosylanthranilate isomerase
MRGVLVKVCGIRTPDDGRVAAEAGADLIGLVFAQSSRRVSIEAATDLITALSSCDGRAPKTVGVFVNEPVERITAIGEALELDFVQFHGDEPPEAIAAIDRPVLKALRLPPGASLDNARRTAERYMAAVVPAVALLVDSHVPGRYGGTGKLGNWRLAGSLAEEYPVILAGGLCTENVGPAITAVWPLGVDVSSGVETGSIKDHDKIRSFLDAVRTVTAPASDGDRDRLRQLANPRRTATPSGPRSATA